MTWLLLGVCFGGWAVTVYLCRRWRRLALQAVAKYQMATALNAALVEELDETPLVVVLPHEMSLN